MKIILIILALSLKASAQDTLVLKGESSVDSSVNSWRQISGAPVSFISKDLTLNIYGLKAGEYQFELRCKDFWGVGLDTVKITVVQTVKISASISGGFLILNTVGEDSIDYYLIEKSEDGKTWQTIAKQPAIKSSQYKIKLP